MGTEAQKTDADVADSAAGIAAEGASVSAAVKRRLGKHSLYGATEPTHKHGRAHQERDQGDAQSAQVWPFGGLGAAS